MKASECKCCICGKQAVAFWPVIDPDIPYSPYCRECLDKEKLKVLIDMWGEEKGKIYFDELKKENYDKHRTDKTRD